MLFICCLLEIKRFPIYLDAGDCWGAAQQNKVGRLICNAYSTQFNWIPLSIERILYSFSLRFHSFFFIVICSSLELIGNCIQSRMYSNSIYVCMDTNESRWKWLRAICNWYKYWLCMWNESIKWWCWCWW